VHYVGSSSDPLLIERLIPLLDDKNPLIAKDVALTIHALRHWGIPFKTNPPGGIPERQRAWWEANKEKLATKDFSEMGLLAKPDLPDIDLCYIGRTPRYDFDAEKNNPAPGDEVTFTAYIKNAGTKPTGAFAYQWYLDGQPAGKGTVESLEPEAQASVEQTWTWQAGPHYVKCVLDPDNAVTEVSEVNNALEDKTNAFISHLWVEKSRYKIYNDEQFYLNIGSNSWEDWAQRQTTIWNFGFRRSVTLLSPEGVVDRVRLDKITLVDDAALPLRGEGPPGNYADKDDKTCDVMWGFDTANLDNEAFYKTNYDMFAYKEGSLPHEMSHARYLIDLYGVGIRGEDISATDALGRRLYNAFSGLEHHTFRGVMMSSGYFWGYSDHSACGLNRRLNVRPWGGNYNASADLGEYLSDLPARTRFTVVDVNGRPVPGAVVLVYQSVADPRPWEMRTDFYDKQVYDPPDMAFTTDRDGAFTIEGSPLSGKRISGYLSNSHVLFRVIVGDRALNHIKDVTEFNLAYWNGGRREARLTIPVNYSSAAPGPPGNVRTERGEGNKLLLKWQRPLSNYGYTKAPSSYRIYRRAGGQRVQSVAETRDTSWELRSPWDGNSEYAVSAVYEGHGQTPRSPWYRRIEPKAQAMFVGRDGNDYVLSGSRLHVVGPDGARVGEWARWIEGATAMTPGPDSTIYFAGATWEEGTGDEKKKLSGIVILGPDAELKARYGVPADDKLALKQPRAIAVDSSGRAAVMNSDASNPHLWVFNADGTLDKGSMSQVKLLCISLTDVISKPISVATGPKDRMYVIGKSQHMKGGDVGFIWVFGPDGQLKTRVDTLEKFAEPIAVAVSPDERIIVAEAGAGRVRVFDLSGKEPRVVREITEADGAPLGKPVAVALDPHNRIVVARESGPPVVLAPPTDFAVRMTPARGVFRKEWPNKVFIEITNVSGRPLDVKRITSKIGQAGTLRQDDLDRACPFTLGPGEAKRIEAALECPRDEQPGVVTAAFQIDTGAGTAHAFTSIGLHDLLERTLVVRKAPVGDGDRVERYEGKLVVTNNHNRKVKAAIRLAAEPEGTGVATRSARQGYDLPPNRTTICPFEVAVPLDWKGLRARVRCRLAYGKQSYDAGFDLERPIPWRMCGLFDNTKNEGLATAYPPEKQVAINEPVVMPDGTQRRWVTVPEALYDERHGVFFHEHFGDEAEWKAIYVTTVIQSPDARDVLLKLGSDDSVVVWLNGAEVHRHDIARGAAPDQDTVKAALRRGDNRVLMKVCNGGGGWGFFFRVTDPAGNPYYDLAADADSTWNPQPPAAGDGQ